MFFCRTYDKKDNKSKAIDENFGTNQELTIKDILEEHFEFPLIHMSQYKYSIYDFCNPEEKVLIELKSRRTRANTFNEVIIGSNKIKYAESFKQKHPNEGWTFFFVFNFIGDEIRMIEYHRDKFAKYPVREMKRVDRQEKSEVIMIPLADTELIFKYDLDYYYNLDINS